MIPLITLINRELDKDWTGKNDEQNARLAWDELSKRQA